MGLLCVAACRTEAPTQCGAGTHLVDGVCEVLTDSGDSGSDTDTALDTDTASDTDSVHDSEPDSDTDTGGDSGADTGAAPDDGLLPGGRWTASGRVGDLALALTGDRYLDDAGYSVAVGDEDGDGHDDVLIGGPYAQTQGSYTGAAWLVRGPVLADGQLAAAATRLDGDAANENFGVAVAMLGDVDGDGCDDVAVGASMTDGLAGAIHIYTGGLPATGGPGDASATWSGEDAQDYAGRSLLGGLDYTGDGTPDLVVGVSDHDTGAAYLLSGAGRMLSGGALSSADVRFYASSDTTAFGYTVSDLGDVNGDGLRDLGIGWFGSGSSRTQLGAYALYFGPITGHYTEADADSVVEGYDEYLVYHSKTVGDVDGDGLDDALLGGESSIEASGTAYLMSAPDLAANGSVRYALATFTGGAATGPAIDAPGDVDGDGTADLLVGFPVDSTYAAEGGVACLWYGPVAGAHTPPDADAAWFGSTAMAYVGGSLAAGHDVTGDHYADLVIGASQDKGDSDASGVVYVVPGVAP